MLNTQTGVFAPASTTKRLNTLNMHDTSASHFYPTEGPYETAPPEEAQGHFNSTREIKLKRGMALPDSTYRHHYPPKQGPPQEELPDECANPSPAPFTATTTYDNEFPAKPFMPRPVEPLTCTYRSPPWLLNETTNQHFYKATPLPNNSPEYPPNDHHQPPPQIPSIWETTHRREFTPKDPPGRQPVGTPAPHKMMPWMANGTTYTDHFVPKELCLRPLMPHELGATAPFEGITEYMDEFVPKEALPFLPPLTGFAPKDGLQLPMPRKSLGVQFWHRGNSTRYMILIPRTMSVPCAAKQMFTTLHDNQEQACILVLYGDDPVASNNQLLGQFDIVNIPPAPKDVPQIEVTFRLDKDAVLTVTARDLDTERMKLWTQRGEIVVCKPNV